MRPQTFQQLLQAGPHDVDVLNADELETNVGVVVLVLVAFTCCAVRQGVQLQGAKTTVARLRTPVWNVSNQSSPYLWPSIHDVDESTVVIGFADGLQHALVF